MGDISGSVGLILTLRITLTYSLDLLKGVPYSNPNRSDSVLGL